MSKGFSVRVVGVALFGFFEPGIAQAHDVLVREKFSCDYSDHRPIFATMCCRWHPTSTGATGVFGKCETNSQ